MAKKNKSFTGKVVSIDISGIGPNSAQLQFTLTRGSESRTFIATAYPGHEPAVFAAYTTLLTGAYFNNQVVGIRFEEVAGETDRVSDIYLPA